MRRFALAAALATVLSGPALADGPGPVMEAHVIEAAAAASSPSAQTVLLLTTLIVFAAAFSKN